MKILILHLTMGLTDRGSEISTDLLASALAKDHQVLVLSAGKLEGKSYGTKRVYPLRVPPPPAPTTPLDKLLFRLALDRRSRVVCRFTDASLSVINEFDPDIVFATNGAGQLRIVKRSFPDIKTVVFGRAGIGHDDLANLRARPDLFIALTPTARDWAAQHAISPTKVVYLPNPIDPQPFTQAKPAKHELPRPILLVVGALTGYKNIPAVISAAAKLRQSLLLIGDGEESGAVNQLLSQYPAPFRWLKHLPPYDLPSYYLAADAFAFTPDPQEAFGRVYLEAMAAGLPIVASDDPIRRALVGKRGIYADPREQSSLVRSIRQALQRGKIDYSEELRPYLLSNVITSLEKELHALAD